MFTIVLQKPFDTQTTVKIKQHQIETKVVKKMLSTDDIMPTGEKSNQSNKKIQDFILSVDMLVQKSSTVVELTKEGQSEKAMHITDPDDLATELETK